MKSESLKQEVRDYWNEESCGTKFTQAEKFTRPYYDEIEEHRYRVEPEIFSFAQFTRFHGKQMLEVGVGAGSDFTQWVRAGTRAHGIDLTPEAVEHVQRRLELYGLKAEEVSVSDAENIQYPDNKFDLVYSWGVIHHSPDTERALSEIVRVTKPGGRIRIMIYNRHSLLVYYKWVIYALLRGKPFKSLAWVLYYHQESPGTKGYTLDEVHAMAARQPVDVVAIQAPVTSYDLLYNQARFFQYGASLFATLLGRRRCGFYLTIDLIKKGASQ